MDDNESNIYDKIIFIKYFSLIMNLSEFIFDMIILIIDYDYPFLIMMKNS